MSIHGHLLRSAPAFVPVLVLALAVGACGTTGGAGDKDASAFSDDQPGDEPVPGVVRIVEVDRSALGTTGTVRYRLANLTREDVDNLSARVTFYYPPSQGGTIALPFETDVTAETSFVLFKGQDDFDFTVTSRAFEERVAAGEKVLATKIDVLQAEPIAMTARENGVAGTLVLNDSVECVGISPEDLRLGLDGAPPQLWIEFENVSGRPLQSLELNVLFLDTQGEDVTGETGWQSMPSLAPGESQRVEVDLSKAGVVRNRPFLVQMRFGSVIG